MSEEDIKVVGLSAKKSGGKANFKIIIAIIGIIVLALGIVAGIILVRQQQNISEEAQTCDEECPGADGVLRNCHPPNTDGTAQESVCNTKGLVSFCGIRNFCCPEAGAPWTTNMTLCTAASPTATPSLTATPIETATSTPSGRASETPTARASGSGTPASIPVTGASWPTILGVGIGVIVVFTSFILAL